MTRSGGMILLLAVAGTACHPAPQPGANALQADTAAAIAAQAESAAAETTGAPRGAPAESTTAPAAPAAGATPVISPVTQPGDTTVEGTVRSVGSVPMVRSVIETDAGRYVVTGPLAKEIGELSGAKVRITGHLGRAAPPPPPMAIAVHAYTLLEVGGEQPHVGTLLSRDGAWWLAGADTVKLTGVPADFPAKAGDKIYVVGDLASGVLALRSYGVIARAAQ
ncbi:MAG TPA: hypothetical protein VJ992_04120 [Gemmatimonadales bacterium]|nr:hypothetical protein [Gemmatimonadales bacterium]